MKRMLPVALLLVLAVAALPAGAETDTQSQVYVGGHGFGGGCLHDYGPPDGPSDEYLPGLGSGCFNLDPAHTQVDSIEIEDYFGADVMGRYLFMRDVAVPIGEYVEFCVATGPIPIPEDAQQLLVRVGPTDHGLGACQNVSALGQVTVVFS